MNDLNPWLARLFGIRRGELARVGTSFLLLALIVMTSYILKPVRNSLFLSQFGAERLPYVYLTVAVVVGLVAAGFSRLVSRFPLERVFIGGALTFSGSLALFWWAIDAELPFTGFVFYVWVSIYAILIPSLFWLSANYVFYANEARRLFSIVGAGGILGSIAGGSLTSILVRFMGTAAMLLAAAVTLIGVSATAAWMNYRERDRINERRYDLRRQEMRRLAQKHEGGLGLVARSRYLRFIALLTVTTIITSTLVDYQFNAVAETSYSSMDALTRFFGTFFASINVLAFVLQLFVAGRILDRLGVGAGLVVLPFALLSSSIGFIILPGLLTAAALKAADDGLGNSLNRSSVEILWLPISLEVKNRAKAWLDMFADRLSRGIAGLILLLTTAVLSFDVGHVGSIIMGLAALWLILTILIRREYLTAFRLSLSRRDIDIGALTEDVRDQQSLSVLRQVLAGSDDKQILYALELVRGTRDDSLLEPLVDLTSHPSSAVRATAVRSLCDYPNPPRPDHLPALLQDRNPEVVASATELLRKIDPSLGRRRLTEVFQSGDGRRIHAILAGMEDSPETLQGLLSEDFVRRFHQSDRPEERELAARALGFLTHSPGVIELLSDLLEDGSPSVARAAAASAGKLRDKSLVPLLIRQLSRRPLVRSARDALVRCGPEVATKVSELLQDERQDIKLRRALPQVLAEFEDQDTIYELLAGLPQRDPALHFQVLRALGKMRSRNGRLRFPHDEVDRLLEVEARAYVTLAGRLLAIRDHSQWNESSSLLLRALEERLELTQERIFRLLGLIHPPGDIYSAWIRLVHGRPPARASALEFLGNLLEAGHKSKVLPLLEATSWEDIGSRGRTLFDLRTPTFSETVVELVTGPDGWLAACAVTLAGDLGVQEARPAVLGAVDHPDAVVRQAAVTALERLEARQ